MQEPSIAECKQYYTDWVHHLSSWDMELFQQLVNENGGLLGIFCPGCAEFNQTSINTKLIKIFTYIEKGPPQSSINNLARATYCLLRIHQTNHEVAVSSIEIALYRLAHHARHILSPKEDYLGR